MVPNVFKYLKKWGLVLMDIDAGMFATLRDDVPFVLTAQTWAAEMWSKSLAFDPSLFTLVNISRLSQSGLGM